MGAADPISIIPFERKYRHSFHSISHTNVELIDETCERIFCSQDTTQPLPAGSSRARDNPLAASPCFYANMLASEKKQQNTNCKQVLCYSFTNTKHTIKTTTTTSTTTIL